MSLSALKIGAVAAAALAISASGAFAAPYLQGTIDHDTKLKANHSNGSPTITWVYEDEHVTIINAWANWFKVKVQRPGPDPIGWVKKNAVDIHYGPGPGPGPGPGVQFCFNGPYGYFCVNN